MFTLTYVQTLVLQCSKSCGGGTRRRGAVCRKAAEAGGDESKCSQRDKMTVQPCNEFLCPQWKTGDWSEVSSALIVLSCPQRKNNLIFTTHIKEIEEMITYTLHIYMKCICFMFTLKCSYLIYNHIHKNKTSEAEWRLCHLFLLKHTFTCGLCIYIYLWGRLPAVYEAVFSQCKEKAV